MSHADPILLFSIVTLVVLGIVILSSASAVLSQQQTGNPYSLLLRQLFFVGLGGMLFFFAQRINYRAWQRWALPLFAGAVALLILVFLPWLGVNHGGSTRWLGIGAFTFQPAELAKLALVVFLSALFAKRISKSGGELSSVVRLLVILSLVSIPITLQPDIGTLGVVIGIGLALFFLAGGRWLHVAALILVGIVGFAGLVQVAPYRLNRLTVFLYPQLDPQGIGYQINQALLTIGSGGIFGRGIGYSRQKHEYLPEPAGDSIFAIGAEELGFVGAIAIILLFAVLLVRGLRVAKRLPDPFGRLLVSGIMVWIGLQALLNMGAITGLLPLTGIPLPLVSLGGSSMTVTLMALGIVMNASKKVQSKK